MLQDGSIKEGKVQVDYATQTINLKTDQGDSSYPFDQVIGVRQGKDNYLKMAFEEQVRYGALLVKGKASLYEITSSEFALMMEDGRNKLLDTKNGQSQIPGILSVFYADCNEMRDLLKYEGNFDRRNLRTYAER